MYSILGRFLNLPGPARGVLILLTGGSILASLYYITGGNRTVLMIVFVGMIVLAVLMLIYRKFLKSRQKKKGRALTRDIEAAAPTGALRQRFQEGLQKFQQAGRDLYSVPWFLLVGESGSGKTEAIRHSQLRFPPGLQDYLQGLGGTRDMHWWFTADSVIIDTAGRMFVSEKEESGRPDENRRLFELQWTEFLKLLFKSRKNCPINGLILVLPADKLIRDTADELERKGREIAAQFDTIQRTLDIRFPVFIVLTKCDLIYGFREFCDSIDGPQLQHQMLGWSNPHSLDDAFDPREVTDSFKDVVESIRQRCLGLLQDPTASASDGRRIDDVDALYAFPDSLSGIVPRLQRYLEIIFAGSEWSPKPLFLRGIYMTSSMREGSALDAQLAEALGVPVESLPEGRAYEKERAFFLRDLFTDKIFRERGLVTRTSNTRRQYHSRRLVLLLTGLVCVVLLLGLTWYWGGAFRKTVGKHAFLWQAAAREQNWVSESDTEEFVPIVSPEFIGSDNYVYNQSVMKVGGAKLTPYGFHSDLHGSVKDRIHIPPVFRAASIGVDLNASRRDGQYILYEAGVLRPLFMAVRQKLAAETPVSWTEKAEKALLEVLRTRAYELGLGDFCRDQEHLVNLQALLEYVVALPDDETQADEVVEEWQGLQGIFDELYADAETRWPPPGGLCSGDGDDGEEVVWLSTALSIWVEANCVRLAGETDDLVAAITPPETENARLKLLGTLQREAAVFEEAERRLLVFEADFRQRYPGATGVVHFPGDRFANVQTEWDDAYRLFDASRKALEAVLMSEDLGLSPEGRTTELYRSTVAQEVADGTEGLTAAFAQAAETTAEQFKAVRGKLLAATPLIPAAFEDTAQGAMDASQKRFVRWLDNAVETRADKAEKEALLSLDEERDKRVTAFEARRAELSDTSVVVALERVDQRLLAAVQPPTALEVRQGFPEALQQPVRQIQRLYELRSIMYGFAQRHLAEPALGMPPDGVWNAFLRMSPDGFRINEAAEVSSFAARLAAANEAYAGFAGKFDGLPMTVPAIRRAVAQQARRRSLPSVSFTTLEAGDVPADYDPEGMLAVVSAWRDVGKALDEEDLVVLDLERLRDMYRESRRQYEDYLRLYTEYWDGTVRSFQVGRGDWETMHRELGRMQDWDITRGIERFVKAVEPAYEALAEVRGDEADEEVEETLERLAKTSEQLDSASFSSKCRDVLAAWNDLDRDVRIARGRVLGMSPNRFQQELLILGGDGPSRDFAIMYWQELSFALLQSFADASRGVAREALQELAVYRRFPLDIPRREEQPLTPQEFRDATQLIGRLFPSVTRYPEGSIGRGTETDSSRVNRALRVIVRPVPDADAQWLTGVGELIEVLPSGADESSTCAVTVLPLSEQRRTPEEASASDVWRLCRLHQGTRTLGTQRTQGNREEDMGKIRYPGENVKLEFYRYPEDTDPDRVLTLAGPWAALQFLFADAGAVNGIAIDGVEKLDDGKTWRWTLQFPDAAAARPRRFHMKLEYDAKLPSPGKWPSE